jgi:hypothetical protein
MHVFESTCRLSLALAGDEFAAVDIHDDVACWQNSAPQKIATQRREDRFASTCFVGSFVLHFAHNIPRRLMQKHDGLEQAVLAVCETPLMSYRIKMSAGR